MSSPPAARSVSESSGPCEVPPKTSGGGGGKLAAVALLLAIAAGAGWFFVLGPGKDML